MRSYSVFLDFNHSYKVWIMLGGLGVPNHYSISCLGPPKILSCISGIPLGEVLNSSLLFWHELNFLSPLYLTSIICLVVRYVHVSIPHFSRVSKCYS